MKLKVVDVDLVSTGERQDDDSDHEISDCERHDELVGSHAAQFTVREYGRDHHHIADNDDDVETDESSHWNDKASSVEPHSRSTLCTSPHSQLSTSTSRTVSD